MRYYEPNYNPTDAEKYAAHLGRILMDYSMNMPMKGLSNDEVARSNRMSAFGDRLTRIGSEFGPKTFDDVIESAGVTMTEAKEFLKLAKKEDK